MSSLKEIKDKKKSITSINKITKSMQLISIAKSKRAINEMKEYREFYTSLLNIVYKIIDDEKNKIVEENEKNSIWIIFGSDLGLAGSYNSNIIKLAKSSIKKNDKLIIIGEKLFSLKKDKNDICFSLNDFQKRKNIYKILIRLKESYIDHNMNVNVINTRYISQLEFKPRIFNLLPITKKSFKDLDVFLDRNIKKTIEENKILEFEPSKKDLLKEIVDIYIETSLNSFLKESIASEETSRRVAMENASKNGEDILDELKIKFNRIRQNKITQEISEIIGGAEALK